MNENLWTLELSGVWFRFVLATYQANLHPPTSLEIRFRVRNDSGTSMISSSWHCRTQIISGAKLRWIHTCNPQQLKTQTNMGMCVRPLCRRKIMKRWRTLPWKKASRLVWPLDLWTTTKKWTKFPAISLLFHKEEVKMNFPRNWFFIVPIFVV